MFSFISSGFLFSFFIIALDFKAGLCGLPFLEITKNELHDCILVRHIFRRNIITNKMKRETRYYIDKPYTVKLCFLATNLNKQNRYVLNQGCSQEN